MITPPDCDSLFPESSPRDRMFRDLPCILRIRRVVIVVLIDDVEGFRVTLSISEDIEEDRNMFLRRVCESIVHLSIEIGDHESLIWWWESTLESSTKIFETLSSDPLIGREISLIRYYFGEGSTLPSIPGSECLLRELRVYTITSIGYSSYIWSMDHHIEILIIHWWLPRHEDRSTWYNTALPVFRGNTREKWEDIRKWREERSGHSINSRKVFCNDLERR